MSFFITCVNLDRTKVVNSFILPFRERGQRLDSHLKQMISDLEVKQKEVPPQPRKSSILQRNKKPNSNGYQKTKQMKEISDTYTFEAAEQILMSDVDEEDENVVPEADMKKYIDTTMAKLINPKKAKEDVISQVSKQIHSMEKFVTFLQSYESSVETDHETTDTARKQGDNGGSSRNTASKTAAAKSSQDQKDLPAPHAKILKMTEEKRKKMHEASIAVIKKGMTVLQIFAISQFGCSARHFREYMIRKSEQATCSSTGYLKPYESFRASVDRLMMLHMKLIEVGGLTPDAEDELNLPISSTDKRASWSRKRSESTSSSFDRYNKRSSTLTSQLSTSSTTTIPERTNASAIQEDLIRLVRGEFSTSLKELVQHGLCQSFQSSNLSTKALVGCMSSHTVQGHGLHIWELFDKFYQLKRGDTFNRQPSNMLSEAFAMDIGCTQQNPKQALLTVLHRIKKTHEPRKRSYDAMYKALVSASLNRGRLAQWIRLVIRCPELVDRHFERWSYVIRTGFDEVLTSLEKLSSLTFFLPEDLAIRHLLKNTNEFGDA